MLRRGGELSADELRAAELGFKQLLRRKRFPAAFINRHASDLLAQARLEYTRHVAAGDDVRSPAGWIIHCAWRRTQNLLEHESRVPRSVSIDEEVALEGPTPTPEEETLQADRHRRVREAVGSLPPSERKLIALTYFEGMSVREASRSLGLANRTGDRRHHSALNQLYALLGVKNSEQLQIEIGAAAWALLATEGFTAPHLPAAVQGTLENAARGLMDLVGRAQDLVRRALTGRAAESGLGAAGARSAEAGGGGILAAATAGVCGAAAVTCLATGVFVPGIAGTDPGDPGRTGESHERQVVTPPPGDAQPGAIKGRGLLSSAPSADVKQGGHRPRQAKPVASGPRARARRTVARPVSAPVAPPHEVGQEFDSFPEESAPSGSESAPRSQSSEPSRPTPPTGATNKQIETEFGL